ncbi:MAG: RNA polymerase sigma factor [Candidatus Polarisedimenticolia bacterium]
MRHDETLAMDALMALEREASASGMTEAQFRAFYDQTAARIWSYLRRLTGSEALADDLLQDTYVRFLGSSFRAGEENQTLSYLYRIATNLVRDHARKHRREVLVESAPEHASTPRADARLDMQRVFERLKPRERSLLWLAHVEGLSHEEISRRTGVAERSVRVVLFRARQKLGDLLKRRGLMQGARRDVS